jgi:hypothetical protein
MIDGGGAGRDKNDDNRVDVQEWLAGYKNVIDHGFIGLQSISSKAEAFETFKKIDDNGGGLILLDEWSFFLKNCEIAGNTPVGRLLAADQSGGVGKKETLFAKKMPVSLTGCVKVIDPVDEAVRKIIGEPKKKEPPSPWAAKSSASKDPKTFLQRRSSFKAADSKFAPVKTAEELNEELQEWLSRKPIFLCDATPNAFGLSVGKTASRDLHCFISVFEPFAADTPEGETLRAEGFISADPNGELLAIWTSISKHLFREQFVVLSRSQETGFAPWQSSRLSFYRACSPSFRVLVGVRSVKRQARIFSRLFGGATFERSRMRRTMLRMTAP